MPRKLGLMPSSSKRRMVVPDFPDAGLKTDHLKLHLFRGSRLCESRKKLSWCPDLEGVDNGKNLHHMVPIPSSRSFRTASFDYIAAL